MEQEQAKPSHPLNLNTAPGGFPGGSAVKNPPAGTGGPEDSGLIPESGRSPGEGNGYPLQDSCLENPRTQNPGAWWATVHGVKESRTQLNDETTAKHL